MIDLDSGPLTSSRGTVRQGITSARDADMWQQQPGARVALGLNHAEIGCCG